MNATHEMTGKLFEIPPEDQELILKYWLLLSDIDKSGGGEELWKECQKLRVEIDKRNYHVTPHSSGVPGDIVLEIKRIHKPVLH